MPSRNKVVVVLRAVTVLDVMAFGRRFVLIVVMVLM
jgi:hypothetical protein